MTVSEKLFMSLLSLDAYSRVGVGSNDPEDPVDQSSSKLYVLEDWLGKSLGNAVITNVMDVPESSFVAVSYEWNGNTVIAFRGTDDPKADLWNGWTVGAGFNWGSHAALSEEFYKVTTGECDVFNNADSNLILTGHSLGGGLAGYLSVLSGATAYGFDHMPFGQAAIATTFDEVARRDPLLQGIDEAIAAGLNLRYPTADNFIGTYVYGEVNSGLRDGSIAMGIGALLNTVLLAVEDMNTIG